MNLKIIWIKIKIIWIKLNFYFRYYLYNKYSYNMNINLHNENLINKIFPKLNYTHKKLIIDSINEICDVLHDHIFNAKTSIFESQMKLNDSKDILGFVILLLPYFDFFKCYEIKSLDDIFKDTLSSKKVFSENYFQSTYYLDHDTKDYKIKDYEDLFETIN